MSKSSIFVYKHVSVFLCVWYTHTRIERNICAHSYEYYIDSVVGIIHTTLSMFIWKGSTHDVFPHENMRPSNTLYVCGFLYRLGLRCEYGDTARRDAFITWIKLSFEWRTSFLLLLLYIHKYNIMFCILRKISYTPSRLIWMFVERGADTQLRERDAFAYIYIRIIEIWCIFAKACGKIFLWSHIYKRKSSILKHPHSYVRGL